MSGNTDYNKSGSEITLKIKRFQIFFRSISEIKIAHDQKQEFFKKYFSPYCITQHHSHQKGLLYMNWKSFFISTTLICSLGVWAEKIDNSSLMPKYKPDSEVVLEKRSDGRLETPDWIKSLILMEVRIDAASKDETVKGLVPVLDHLAEMGVNGIWLTPPINTSTGYGNFGIHTVSARLTGEKEPEKQWQVLRNFVDEAHKRNIRVFFDVVTWGVTQNEGGAPIHKEKPEWFGDFSKSYAGWFWKWDNKELNEWFASRLIEWFLMTGVDGFRCDCEPQYAGFELFSTVKKRMRQFGRKVVFISEWASSRKNAFDLEQNSFCYKSEKGNLYARWYGDWHMNAQVNLVDDIKNGTNMKAWDDFNREPGMERYYTYILSCHDSPNYLAKGNPISIGYQALFAPFIPLWYIGEEWNNPSEFFVDSYYRYYRSQGWWKDGDKKKWHLYGNTINWSIKDKNQEFFELIKKMIRIRRQNPEIFEYFAENHRNANICKVQTDQTGLQQAYARFGAEKAILIVPNNTRESKKIKITIPYKEMQLKENKEYIITDLLTDKVIEKGKISSFETIISPETLGVFQLSLQK